jgi:hypothetical protein
VIESRPAIDDALPPEWLDSSDEARVIVGSGLILRPLSLEGLSGHELLEAARFEAEPSLPLPFASLAVTAFENGRTGRSRHVIVAAIPASTLDEVRAWARGLCASLAAGAVTGGGEKSARLPIAWIGPALAALRPTNGDAITGGGWAAVAGEGRWLQIQSAPSAEAAATALERDHKIEPAPAWRASDPSLESEGAAAARDRGSWVTGPSSARAASARNRWPFMLAAASLLLLAASFGLRYAAAERRAAAASAAAADAYARAVPGGRAVAPREQLKARIAETRRVFGVLRARVEKESSALDLLALLEESAPQGSARVDDLRITSRDFTVTGSAISVEVVQNLAQSLRTPKEGTGAPPREVSDPEARRSQGGLGFDFTLRGVR